MFTEDLSAFFDTTTGFAISATLGGGGTVPVIFDNGYANTLGGLVESTGPQCHAKTADVSTIIQGNTLVIGGTTYTITGVQPDGTGITTLQLRG
jgi:hypothetical protein